MSISDIKVQTAEISGGSAVAAVRPSYEEIVDWCKIYVGKTLGLPAADIAVDTEFDALGFDSSAAVALVGEAEIWLNLELEPAVLFEYPTISAFAKYLSKQ